jgi:hypothetical protein
MFDSCSTLSDSGAAGNSEDWEDTKGDDVNIWVGLELGGEDEVGPCEERSG